MVTQQTKLFSEPCLRRFVICPSTILFNRILVSFCLNSENDIDVLYNMSGLKNFEAGCGFLIRK